MVSCDFHLIVSEHLSTYGEWEWPFSFVPHGIGRYFLNSELYYHIRYLTT